MIMEIFDYDGIHTYSRMHDTACTLDGMFKATASDHEKFKDHFVRRMYPFDEEIMNKFIHEALQLTSLPLDEQGCYECSADATGVAEEVCELLKKHYAEVVAALLTYTVGDCVIMNNGWQSVLEKGFADESREEIGKHIWKTKSVLPIVLVREALLDALDGISLEDYSEDNLKSSRVFATLKMIEAVKA